jgi:hypothetical protein
MAKKTKQIAIGSLKVDLKDIAGSVSKTSEVAALEQSILQRQIDAAREKPDLLKAIRDALPKR